MNSGPNSTQSQSSSLKLTENIRTKNNHIPTNTKNTGSKKWKQISKKISNFSFPDLKNEEVYVHWGVGQGGVGGSKHPNPAVKHQAPDLTTQGNKVFDAFSQRRTGSEKTVKCYKSLLTKHLSVHSKQSDALICCP